MTLPPEVPLTLQSRGVQGAFISTLATVPRCLQASAYNQGALCVTYPYSHILSLKLFKVRKIRLIEKSLHPCINQKI